MTGNVDIVKKLFEACKNKDYDTVRSLVHADYSLKDPMMELHSLEELVDMIESCPSGGWENLAFVADGDKVVSIFDGVMKEPVSAKLRMCSVITIDGGKVKSEEMFYDTAKVPQELKDMMQKGKVGDEASAVAH